MLSISAKPSDVEFDTSWTDTFLACHRLPIHTATHSTPISDRKPPQNPRDTHLACQTTINDYVLSRHAPRQSKCPYLIRNVLRT
jgi:hypothetical protein